MSKFLLGWSQIKCAKILANCRYTFEGEQTEDECWQERSKLGCSVPENVTHPTLYMIELSDRYCCVLGTFVIGEAGGNCDFEWNFPARQTPKVGDSTIAILGHATIIFIHYNMVYMGRLLKPAQKPQLVQNSTTCSSSRANQMSIFSPF